MKSNFIKTRNVKRFISLMDSLKKAPPNVSKMALVYGEFGLGKSQAIMWWVTNNLCSMSSQNYSQVVIG